MFSKILKHNVISAWEEHRAESWRLSLLIYYCFDQIPDITQLSSWFQRLHSSRVGKHSRATLGMVDRKEKGVVTGSDGVSYSVQRTQLHWPISSSYMSPPSTIISLQIICSNFQSICKLNYVLGKSSLGLSLEVPSPVNADLCFAWVLDIAQPSKLTVKINHHLGKLEITLSVISKTRLHEASFSIQGTIWSRYCSC